MISEWHASLEFEPGTVLVIDRGYIDYQWFVELTRRKVYFVTRLKENAGNTRPQGHFLCSPRSNPGQTERRLVPLMFLTVPLTPWEFIALAALDMCDCGTWNTFGGLPLALRRRAAAFRLPRLPLRSTSVARLGEADCNKTVTKSLVS